MVNANEINMADYIKSTGSESATDDSVKSSSESKSVFDPDKLGNEPTSSTNGDKVYYRVNKDLPIVLNYTLVAESENELYVNYSASRIISGVNVYVNGELLDSWASYSFYSQVLRLGSFEVGQEVQVTLTCDSSKLNVMDVNFAYFDNEVFSQSFEKIDLSGVTVTSEENGVIEMTSNLSEDKMIITSIPFEDGWELYIDGQKADISVYQEALIGINPGAGQHDITLKFVAPGTKIGAVCSVIGIIGLVAILIFDKKQLKTTKD